MFFLAAIGAQPVSALLRRYASRRRPRSIARGAAFTVADAPIAWDHGVTANPSVAF
ncbi:hypothetical protein D558_3374 [Bordetella holmesii 44057]|nr:hypothetical protein D558_3374 [Bordetella holmesii 44057]